MRIPHLKKANIENGKGYGIFKTEKKIYMAEMERTSEGWIIRGVPFFYDGKIRLYEILYDSWERNRYLLSYPFDGYYSRVKLIHEFNIGIEHFDKIVSYYGKDDVYAGIIRNGYLVISRGDDVEIYRGVSKLLARVKPQDVPYYVDGPFDVIFYEKQEKIKELKVLSDLL